MPIIFPRPSRALAARDAKYAEQSMWVDRHSNRILFGMPDDLKRGDDPAEWDPISLDGLRALVDTERAEDAYRRDLARQEAARELQRAGCGDAFS